MRVKPNLVLAFTGKHGQKDNQGAETENDTTVL